MDSPPGSTRYNRAESGHGKHRPGEDLPRPLQGETDADRGRRSNSPILDGRRPRRPEGVAAQILHIGPYADEQPTINELHEYIHGNGHELAGWHHEIYLSDPRKADPAKMRTIIRQPFIDA